MTEKFASRLKVYFEKDNTIERVIEVPKEENLEYLHLTILASIDFSAGEYASFWLTEPNTWDRTAEVPLLNMDEGKEGEEPTACMKDVPISAAINQKQNRLVYVYDMLLMWEFKIEWHGDFEKNPKMPYPILVSEKGKAPNQIEAEKQFQMWEAKNTKLIDNDEDDDIFSSGGGSDDSFDDEDFYDDEYTIE